MSDNMDLKETLNAFLQNKDMHGFLLTGPWGVGKTYEINDWVESLKGNNEYAFVYLPLFGIRSVNELNSMAINSTSLISKIGSYLKKINQDISGGSGPINISIPLIGVVANLIKEDYSKSKKKKYVFIIDDIERRDNKLSIEEIFGFIDQLPKINTKVILITNLEKVEKNDKKETFRFFKEKVIQWEYNIAAPKEEAIKAVAGNDIYKILSCYSSYITNLRTLIKLKNIIASLPKIPSEPIIKCLYFCLLSNDENFINKTKLRDLFLQEEKESSKFIDNSYGKKTTIDEIEKRVDERLSEISKDSDVLYEYVKQTNIDLGISSGKLKETISTVYDIMDSTSYDKLLDFDVSQSIPLKKIEFDWSTVFYAKSPTDEYEKCMNQLLSMLGNAAYDQVKVFTTFYSIKLNCDKYVKKNSEGHKLSKRFEKECIEHVARALVTGDYDNRFNGINSLVYGNALPKYLINLENKIYDLCLKIVFEDLLNLAKDGLLTITYMKNSLGKLQRAIDYDCVTRIDIDKVLLTKIKILYKEMTGNIENIWDEADHTLSWIYDFRNKCNLSGTIAFLVAHSTQNSLQSKRLSVLVKYYGFDKNP